MHPPSANSRFLYILQSFAGAAREFRRQVFFHLPKRVSKRNVNVVNTINKETDEHSEIDDKHVSFMDLLELVGRLITCKDITGSTSFRWMFYLYIFMPSFYK